MCHRTDGETVLGGLRQDDWPANDDLMFQIGLFPTTFGIVLSVVGALIITFISRYGIFHGVWCLGSVARHIQISRYSFVDWLELGALHLSRRLDISTLFSSRFGTAAFLRI